jgi:hypothetical protein
MSVVDTLNDLRYAFFKDPGAYSTKWLNGTGPPTGATPGRKGDYYVDTVTGDYYHYNGSAWVKLGNISGDPTIRITRPNIDDRLVEAWNGTNWSVIDYNSGWRDINLVDSMLGTSYICQVCRKGGSVYFDLFSISRPEDIEPGYYSATKLPEDWHPRSFQIQVSPVSLVTVDLETLGHARIETSQGLVLFRNDVTIPKDTGFFISMNWAETSHIPTSLPGTLSEYAPQ